MDLDRDGEKRGFESAGSNGEPAVQKLRTTTGKSAEPPPAAAINGPTAPEEPGRPSDDQVSQAVDMASVSSEELASRTQKVLNEAIAAAEEAAAEDEL